MSFVKDSINTLFVRIFVYLITICISIYIARMLGPQAKGIYALLTELVLISVLLMDFGIQNASVFFLGKGEKLSKIYPNLISLSIISSLAVLISLFLLLGFLTRTVLKDISLGLILIAIFTIPFKILSEVSRSVILGMNKIKLLNSLKIANFLLLLIIFAALVIMLHWGIKGAILSFAFTEVIMVFVCLLVISNWSKICLRFDLEVIKKFLGYGLRSFLGPLFLLLIFRIDFFLLNYFKDTSSVGFYSVAVSLGELLYFIPEVIGMILFPKLLSGSAESMNENAARVIRTISLLLAVVTLLLFVFVPKIVFLIYGEQYAPSILLARILLPGFLIMSLYYIFFSYFYSKGRPEIVSFVVFLTMIFKILLAVILIPLLGIKGAAFASAITNAFCGVTLMVFFLTYSNKTVLDIFFIKSSDLKYLYRDFNAFRKSLIPRYDE